MESSEQASATEAESSSVHFGMKKLALGNWCQPDIPQSFPGITEEGWVSRVMEPQLITAVPQEVIRLFEVARGSILYGWFFYPLLTLANEQLHRVQETAVRERCKLAGIPTDDEKKGKRRPRNFARLLAELGARGIVPPESVIQWEAVRQLRNWSSHPERQSIIPPGLATAGVEATARQINQLFADNPDYFSLLGYRVRRATGLDDKSRALPAVVGIDVGGAEKGYHLVAIHGGLISGTLATTDSLEAARWCGEQKAMLVAIDAPSGWSMAGDRRCREAEEMLSRFGYSSHSTPTRENAAQNRFYAWMLNGERLYQAIRTEYPLFSGKLPAFPFCFETYPYLAACAYAGRRLHATDKNADRRDVIRAAGLDDRSLRNIDYVDAAICALVACSVSIDYCTAVGNAEEGFIISPPLH